MNPRSDEQISVCVLAFDHVHLIESTLRTILNQSCADFEMIVSDDCSTDGTWEKILQMAAHDPRIRAVQTPRNLGMPGNANFAVSQSKFPLIALLHHDDLYREDLLDKWSGALRRNPAAGFVFNAYGAFDSPQIDSHSFESECFSGKWFLKQRLLRSWGCPVRGTAMIRRSCWQKAGGMREEFGLLADVDLWMRLAALAQVAYVCEPLITIRQQRPPYYPDIYKEDRWSWQRQRHLYDIHAANLRANDEDCAPRWLQWPQWLRWQHFRLRVSLETAKWLTYALARDKQRMMATSGESATPYDQFWLRLYRRLARLVARKNAPARQTVS